MYQKYIECILELLDAQINRKVSHTKSEETSIWDPWEQLWIESDAHLRERIKDRERMKEEK